MVMGIPVEPPIDIVGAGDTFLQPWPVHMLQVFQGPCALSLQTWLHQLL